MTMKLVVVDYGSGNLRSVVKSLETAATDAKLPRLISVSDDPKKIAEADYLVLPGVGSFADCRQALDAIPGMVEALENVARIKCRPFLGICVGMQLLASSGDEGVITSGLNWLGGDVKPLKPDHNGARRKVPHMGWNTLDFHNDDHPLFDGVQPQSRVYFLHGYHLVRAPADKIIATTDYGDIITAAVADNTTLGVQFHPEKSQYVGQQILTNWMRWTP